MPFHTARYAWGAGREARCDPTEMVRMTSLTPRSRAHISRLYLVALIALAFATGAVFLPEIASAATATASTSAVQTFSVEASATSVASGDGFGYTVAVRARRAIPSLRVRLRVYTSGGWILYQKTEYVRRDKPGVVRVTLGRPATEAPVEPGVYRAEISVLAPGMAEPLTESVPLRVFDPKRERVPIVVALRVSGPPMTDPQGRFVVDPAEPNAAFDAAVSAANLVLGDVRVRLAIAVSPVLLSEWRRAAGGYQVATEGGVSSVASGTPTPLRYAQGLARIREAVATKRLELLSLGYADPNPSWLARAGLVADLGPQYALGARETSFSLAASPTAGTAVAGSCIPPAVAPLLPRNRVRWVVLDQRCVALGKGLPPTGAYRTTVTGLRAIVSDTISSRAMLSGETSPTLNRAFQRFSGRDSTLTEASSPFVVSVNVGAGLVSTRTVEALVSEVTAEPWARLASTTQAFARASARKVAFKDVATPDRAPVGYWEEVRRARQAAESLAAALSPTSPDAVRANRDGLVAESSGFAGPDRSWAFADRGRAYSAAASRRFRVILGRVRLAAPDVTLAGSAGDVPITITNPTRRVLRVVFIALDTERVVRVGGRRELLLRPGDTFLTLKVDLRSSLSSTLRLAVRAGGTDLDTDTVLIRASYIDRLAIILGVLVLLGGFLVFIVFRVRAAEKSADSSIESSSSVRPDAAAEDGAARYTDESSGEHESGVRDTP